MIKKDNKETSWAAVSKSELQAVNFSITHEIKAPVRAIDGYARIFLEDYGQKIDPDGLALINNIRIICKDTLKLINDLLDYTKLVDAEPILEMIDLNRMIQDVFDELVFGYSENQNTRLNLDVALPPVLSDRTLIRQVIVNVISNSLKFTRDTTIGIISVGYITEKDEIIFYIKDNGVGFDMKYSENLFGMFQRMHSLDDFEGSGVGLAIVKNIIQKLGGRVWITGEVGNGACIYFTIMQKNIFR